MKMKAKVKLKVAAGKYVEAGEEFMSESPEELVKAGVAEYCEDEPKKKKPKKKTEEKPE